MLPIPDAEYPTSGGRSFMFKRSATHHHQGVDVVVPDGTPVHAARSGIVEVSHDGPSRRRGFTGYGKVVVILHDDGNRTLYAHLQNAEAKEGERVSEGERIGLAGRTSYSKAPDYSNVFTHSLAHLHFEVSPRPYPQPSEAPRLDPIAWLQEPSSTPPVDVDEIEKRLKKPGTPGGEFVALALIFVGALWLRGGNS